MKILLCILPSLQAGGAEKVITTLLHHFDRTRFQLHLALIHRDTDPFFSLPPDITVHYLNCSRVLSAFFPLLRLIRKIKPHNILSTLGHLNLIVLLLRPLLSRSTKIFVREGSIVSQNISKEPFPRCMSFLYRKLYPRATGIICQSRYMKEDLCSHFSISSSNCHIIYNPVERINYSARTTTPYTGPGPHLLFAGRLDPVKRINEIITHMIEWKELYPDIQLNIVGEGPLRHELTQQAQESGVGESIHFRGKQNPLHQWLYHADLCILNSRYEGLPNVLLEAVAAGCPLLVRQHPGGTHEVLELLNLSHSFVPTLKLNPRVFTSPPEISRQKLEKHMGVPTIVSHYSARLDQ